MSAPVNNDIGSLDRRLFAEGIELLAGMDEAGRGPLAGPVCAAVVVFRRDVFVNGVNDSKKLSAAKRERLFEQIIQMAEDFAIGWADPEEIDSLNILQATKLAMRRALTQLRVLPGLVLIDAVKLDGSPFPCRPIIRGDAQSHAIAAASILAKVSRDQLMVRYDEDFPGYAFAQHKGYPTSQHRQAVAQLGLTTIHRRSFLDEDLFQHFDAEPRRSRTFEHWKRLFSEKVPNMAAPDWESLSRHLPQVELRELRQLWEAYSAHGDCKS